MDTNLQIKTVFNLDTGIIPISHIGMKYNTKLTYECFIAFWPSIQIEMHIHK